jgi:hypothetical protein
MRRFRSRRIARRATRATANANPWNEPALGRFVYRLRDHPAA